MSTRVARGSRVVLAATGMCLLGAGLATQAEAAPAAPHAGPAANAPAPGLGAASIVPRVTDLPAPFVFQPVDATNGLLGIPRGSVPEIGTPDATGVGAVDSLPGLGVTPLPSKGTSAPAPHSGGSAMAGLDDAGFRSGMPTAYSAH